MVELLSPAGDFEKLRAAIRFGADAVYLAGKSFGMRAAAGCFSESELQDAVSFCHARQKRVYLTVNTMPRTHEYPALREFLSRMAKIPFDAYIAADLGVISLIKEISPERKIHISTQASVTSAKSAAAYYSLGASRVVLSRELCFEEIEAIRAETPPELELEVFIHGAMCVSYSGRCLLSSYLTGRDANRGMCAQPCRWEYDIVERSRQGEPLPIEGDGRGTFIFGSKDLCMIEHIPRLLQSGVCSFKIEGRMKSAYYAAVTANAYRMAIDSFVSDPEGYRFNPEWLKELESVSHREYDTGFFLSSPEKDAKVCSFNGYLQTRAYIGECFEYDPKKGVAGFIQKNKLSVGDRAELLSPGKTGRAFTVTGMKDENGNDIESCPHPSMKFYINMPFEANAGDMLRK